MLRSKKAVLLSTQPKWCELIASGKKTVEVRKTKPKLETPFKVYIYCTKDEPLYRSGVKFCCNNGELGNGKVIGEFVCDKIFDICIEMSKPDDLKGYPFPCTGLTDKEILQYLGNGKNGYGWHISDLVMYDEPKELSEFSTVDNEAVNQCEHRERIYNNPDFTNGAMLPGSYLCNDKINWCRKCKIKPITRPPQSWCYVEELG